MDRLDELVEYMAIVLNDFYTGFPALIYNLDENKIDFSIFENAEELFVKSREYDISTALACISVVLSLAIPNFPRESIVEIVRLVSVETADETPCSRKCLELMTTTILRTIFKY